MKYANRAAAIGLLTLSLITPAAAFAATPAAPNGAGTLVGSVTCGSADTATVGHAMVAIEGIDLSTHANDMGQFVLSGVPALQSVTVDAIVGPDGSAVASRYDVTVGAGETLDVGAIDLAVCPAQSASIDQQPQPEQAPADANND